MGGPAVLPPFKNEPLTDFSQPDRAAAYRLALAGVRRGFGGHKPLIIGGREVDTGDSIGSLNPCKPARGDWHRGRGGRSPDRPGL